MQESSVRSGWGLLVPRYTAAGATGAAAALVDVGNLPHQQPVMALGAPSNVLALSLLLLLPLAGCAQQQEQQPLPSTACDLQRVDARTLTPRRFRDEYQGRAPVVLTHATEGWAARDSWASAEAIAAAHGAQPVSLQDPAWLTAKGTFAPFAESLPLRDHLSNLSSQTEPIFRNRPTGLTDLLLAAANLSSHALASSLRMHHIFSLGNTNTGVGFHIHGENWLGQIQGRKTWSLAPPGRENKHASWQRLHGCDFVTGHVSPKPMQCTVEPGEGIYIPNSWHHATCNLDALTLSLGGQGDIGDASRLVVAILDNDEAGAAAVLGTAGRKKKRQLLRSHVHSGQSAVHMAIMHGRVWALRLLQAAGAKLDEPMHCSKPTIDGKKKIICLLITGSPWWKEPSPAGIHPLYLAAVYNQGLGVIEYLTAPDGGGLDVATAMKVGRKVRSPVGGASWRYGVVTVAHVACHHNGEQVLQWAVSRNAELAAMPDSQGRLPIHWCAEEANAPMLRILLGLGEERARGQLTHRDEKGKTAEEILSEAQVGDGTGDMMWRGLRGPGGEALEVLREARERLLGREL